MLLEVDEILGAIGLIGLDVGGDVFEEGKNLAVS